MEQFDAALEEYKALRAEILARSQAETTLVSIALTVTAAIAGIAFGAKAKDEARLQILLALPLVISGLGLAYLKLGHGSVRIGHYLRTELWPTLAQGELPSWEERASQDRTLLGSVTTVRGWLSFLPGVFIFGAPSVAALVINWNDYSWVPPGHGASGLRWAWFLGLVATCVCLLFLLLAARQPKAKGSSRTPRPDVTRVRVLAEFPDGEVKTGTLHLKAIPEESTENAS